jgi:hypothetical protein
MVPAPGPRLEFLGFESPTTFLGAYRESDEHQVVYDELESLMAHLPLGT